MGTASAAGQRRTEGPIRCSLESLCGTAARPHRSHTYAHTLRRRFAFCQVVVTARIPSLQHHRDPLHFSLLSTLPNDDTPTHRTKPAHAPTLSVLLCWPAFSPDQAPFCHHQSPSGQAPSRAQRGRPPRTRPKPKPGSRSRRSCASHVLGGAPTAVASCLPFSRPLPVLVYYSQIVPLNHSTTHTPPNLYCHCHCHNHHRLGPSCLPARAPVYCLGLSCSSSHHPT